MQTGKTFVIRSMRGWGVALLLALLFAGASPAQVAQAANFVVSNTNDSGPGSLREAIEAANATAGADTITFSTSGAITLASTLPAISDAAGLTIDGAGQTVTVSGGGTVRVMLVEIGAALTVKNLTIANGNSGNTYGGGIYNYGTLTVANSTFAGNRTNGNGGGIYNYFGALTVINSTFSGNSAGASIGGAGGGGGGIYNNSGTLTVTNSTFSRNGTGDSGGGIYNGGGTSTLRNTIVANNLISIYPVRNCSGAITDGGGNLVWGDSSCPSTFINADPKLLALANNGGATQTMALDTGSAAIDAALPAHCPATDQRGVSRPQGAHCDIGAFEAEQAPDSTAPAIIITTPPDGAIYVLGQFINADYACEDEAGGSGVASCIGDVVSGHAIDTNSVGTKSFTVNAADNAGNTASLTHHYSVVYSFSGFLQPVDNYPTVNTVNAGAAVPVRFSLGGNQGLDIFASGYPKAESYACGAQGDGSSALIEETVTNPGKSSLQYDPATDTYTYVWKTDKAWAGTCRRLVVKLTDNSEHVALFRFNGKARSDRAADEDESASMQLFLPLVNR